MRLSPASSKDTIRAPAGSSHEHAKSVIEVPIRSRADGCRLKRIVSSFDAWHWVLELFARETCLVSHRTVAQAQCWNISSRKTQSPLGGAPRRRGVWILRRLSQFRHSLRARINIRAYERSSCVVGHAQQRTDQGWGLDSEPSAGCWCWPG